MRGTIKRTELAKVFAELTLPSCHHIRGLLANCGVTVIQMNMDNCDGALLGDVLIVNVNNGPNRRAFTKLHGLYHSLRAGPKIALPL